MRPYNVPATWKIVISFLRSVEKYCVISLSTIGRGSLKGFDQKYTIMEKMDRITPRKDIISFLRLTVKANTDAHIAQKYNFSLSIHKGIAKRLLSTGIICRIAAGYSIKTVLYIFICNHARIRNPAI